MKLTTRQKTGVLLLLIGLVGFVIQRMFFQINLDGTNNNFWIHIFLRPVFYGVVLLGILLILINKKSVDSESKEMTTSDQNTKQFITILNTVFTTIFLLFVSPAFIFGGFMGLASSYHHAVFETSLFLLVLAFPISNILALIFFWKGYKNNKHKQWLYFSILPWIHLLFIVSLFFIL